MYAVYCCALWAASHFCRQNLIFVTINAHISIITAWVVHFITFAPKVA